MQTPARKSKNVPQNLFMAMPLGTRHLLKYANQPSSRLEFSSSYRTKSCYRNCHHHITLTWLFWETTK